MVTTVRSPLAPADFPEMPPVKGVQIGAIAAQIRYRNRDDLFLAALDAGSVVAGVLTRSKTRSDPVEWCAANLAAGGKARAIIANAGNSNAFTGAEGRRNTERMAAAAAKALGCKAGEVLTASTGVIGEQLAIEKIEQAVPALQASLSTDAWPAAARAIMTTDTFAKMATRQLVVDGKQVTIAGIAKGSGMIAPDMATMLAFIFTDVAITQPLLQSMTRRAADRSFNAITVDGDTSTSDTVLVAATGKAGNPQLVDLSSAGARSFARALEAVMQELAILVVKDGEGASKFVTIDVTGATSAKAAQRIGLSIANSPLVKTAIAGQDANWGRIVMAVGKSGEKADRDKLRISMGGIVIAEKGAGVQGYDEAPVAAHLKGDHINIAVDLGLGRGKSRIWTCDLTHGYIDINADYRS